MNIGTAVPGSLAEALSNAPAPITPPAISLEQRLEQIDQAVNEAHALLDEILPPETAPAVQADEAHCGADPSALRAIEGLQLLNVRLKYLAERVGRL